LCSDVVPAAQAATVERPAYFSQVNERSTGAEAPAKSGQACVCASSTSGDWT
jgi:hypothetical protein